MFLSQKRASHSSLFSPNPKKPAASAIVSKPFEETLIARLTSLLPVPDSSPSIPLPWLSRSIDLLTLTLADATALFSDPSLSAADLAALSSHLDSTVSLLDACNAISAAADRILHARLLLLLALRLISSPPSPSPDRLCRALSAIAEWEAADASPPPSSDPADLSRLQPKPPNRGKLTSIGRAIYAVQAISNLVVRSALAFLGEKGDFLAGVRVSADFGWAPAYNEVAAKVSAKVCCGEIAEEIEAVRMRARKLAGAVGGDGGGGEVTEGLREAVTGAEEAIEVLTEGMDRLANGVNALFNGALETREAALQCFRVGPGRCK